MLCLTLEPRSAGRSTKEDPLCNGEFLTNILAEGYYYYYLSTRNQIVFLFSAKNDENVNLSGSINCVIRSTIDGAGVKTFRIEVTKNFIFKFWTTFVVVIQANCQLHFFATSSSSFDGALFIIRSDSTFKIEAQDIEGTYLHAHLPTYPPSYLQDNDMLGIGVITPSYQPTHLPT